MKQQYCSTFSESAVIILFLESEFSKNYLFETEKIKENYIPIGLDILRTWERN